jgi:ATP-dependent RNA helicase RhlE
LRDNLYFHETKDNMTFEEMDLIEPLKRALKQEGYEIPTPIQVGAIPLLLKGRDLLGLAQTGTGKTAAFALPILQKLASGGRSAPYAPRALVLTPTRELAVQIAQSFAKYGRHLKLKVAMVFGGVGQEPQARALSRGVDILVATPGRLLDLMSQRLVKLGSVEIFTLDEADRMLDMGFIIDVERIVETLPAKRQSLLFSATMPQDAERLASSLLNDPITVAVNPISSAAERIEQKLMFVGRDKKDDLLKSLLDDQTIYRMLVFTRTKHRANRLAEKLNKLRISADSIHGNKSQGARQRALSGFISGRTRVLVATDIAARGIDISGISHVVNFELPNEPESYIHRIGRTARAGAEGIAISFCDMDEHDYLHAIERIIKVPITVDATHPFHCAATASARRVAGRKGSNFGYNGKQRYGQRFGAPRGPARSGERSGGERPGGQRPGGERAGGGGYAGRSNNRSGRSWN